MKICANCGKELADHVAFCSNCGAPQVMAAPQPEMPEEEAPQAVIPMEAPQQEAPKQESPQQPRMRPTEPAPAIDDGGIGWLLIGFCTQQQDLLTKLFIRVINPTLPFCFRMK